MANSVRLRPLSVDLHPGHRRGAAVVRERASRPGIVHINSQTAGADVHVPFGGTRARDSGPHEQGGAAGTSTPRRSPSTKTSPGSAGSSPARWAASAPGQSWTLAREGAAVVALDLGRRPPPAPPDRRARLSSRAVYLRAGATSPVLEDDRARVSPDMGSRTSSISQRCKCRTKQGPPGAGVAGERDRSGQRLRGGEAARARRADRLRELGGRVRPSTAPSPRARSTASTSWRTRDSARSTGSRGRRRQRRAAAVHPSTAPAATRA